MQESSGLHLLAASLPEWSTLQPEPGDEPSVLSRARAQHLGHLPLPGTLEGAARTLRVLYLPLCHSAFQANDF